MAATDTAKVLIILNNYWPFLSDSHEERFIASRQSMIEEEPGFFLSQK
jgi:hypothetical protein